MYPVLLCTCTTWRAFDFCWKIILQCFDWDIHRVSEKTVPVLFFLNNSVKHWPTLIIFGVHHHNETWQLTAVLPTLP